MPTQINLAQDQPCRSYTDYKTEEPSTSHEVTLHVAFVHAFVNPALFIALHKGLRKAAVDLICCNFRSELNCYYLEMNLYSSRLSECMNREKLKKVGK